MSKQARPNRSVVDYDTEEALRKALMAVKLPDSGSDEESPGNGDMTDDGVPSHKPENLDWVLPCVDPDTTEPQSMKEELHRLQVLKSYMILDAEREEAFERLTRLAARFFDVPIALVSLVDLGRQWFMSNRGLGDVRETPRKHAFCAHVVLSKLDMLIVPDASKDFRFKDNPLVTGPPDIRFYAGAALLSPEGYKLGTFCVIDSRTRPAGLSQEEQSTLRDFADMAVKELVARRSHVNKDQSPAQLIAYTAHDLMTPLTGVQLSLSLLKGDEESRDRLGSHQQELLTTAVNCSDLMIRICQTAIETLRGEYNAVVPALPSSKKGCTPMTKMSELIKSLAMIMEPLPKSAPLVITLDPDVPQTLVTDDLKLFRSALNLISNGVSRTNIGLVHFRIYVKSGDGARIVFECSDTGPNVEVEEYQYLFKPSLTAQGDVRLGLSSVATLINALDGEYGFHPRSEFADGRPRVTQRGALFWFSVPLLTPESYGVNTEEELPVSVVGKTVPNTKIIKKPVIPAVPSTALRGSFSGVRDIGFGALNGSPANAVFGTSLGSSLDTPGLDRNGLLGALGRRKSSYNSLSSPGAMGGRKGSSNSLSSQGHLPQRISVVGENARFPYFDGPSLEQKTSLVTGNLLVPSLSNNASVAKPSRRKRRALIIEDCVVVRKALARALEKLSLTVTQAVNGLEGLKSMKAQMFDFVLCDFLMPVMDGLDCVKQYREWEKQNRPAFRQYIVGISAHAGANDGDKGIKAGMNEFRPKPVSIKTLTEIEKANQVADNARLLDEMEQTNGELNSKSNSAGSLSALGQSQISNSPSMHLSSGIASSPKRNHLQSPSSEPNCGSEMVQKAKMQRVDHGFVLSDDQGLPVCLFATDATSRGSNNLWTKLKQEGWKVVVVRDGQEALRLLKMRNWNTVLIDDDIPLLSCANCMKEFRVWEQHNRVSRQRNVYLVCSEKVPSVFETHSIMLPPTGFDGVLGRPVEWNELNHMLGMKRGRSFDIIVHL